MSGAGDMHGGTRGTGLRPHECLVVSGFDPAGEGRGGLFAWTGGELTRVDDRCTTGLARYDGALYRCLWNDGREHADLDVVGEHGLLWQSRLDGVGNPHDVLVVDGFAVVVATEQNQLAWFAPDGRRVRTWQPPGEPDSWHLNSLVLHEGRLLVCAFGRFARRKEWDLLGRPASGCVVDVETQAVVLDGLRAPHTPRFVDGRWLVCNSGDGELLALAADGGRTVLAKVDGWPRGLAVTPAAVYVGVSPPRHELDAPGASSSVVVLDRRSWDVVADIPVPAREVYDLAVVSDRVVAAVARTSCTSTR